MECSTNFLNKIPVGLSVGLSLDTETHTLRLSKPTLFLSLGRTSSPPREQGGNGPKCSLPHAPFGLNTARIYPSVRRGVRPLVHGRARLRFQVCTSYNNLPTGEPDYPPHQAHSSQPDGC